MKRLLQAVRVCLALLLVLSCSSRQVIILRGAAKSVEHVSPWESFPEGTAGNSYKKHYKLKRNLLAVSSEENERLNQRAIALLMNGDFLESEIIFKTIVKYGPKDSAVINNMAILQELRNRDDRAFIYYNEALNIAPHNNYIRENFIRFKYKPENLKIYGEPLPE